MSRKENGKPQSFEVMEGHYLVGNRGIYKVQKFLGEGSFGKVAKCSKLGSQECFAIKIMKCSNAGQSEFEAMKLIKDLDPDESCLIKMYECFTFQNMTCIVYELLLTSLFEMCRDGLKVSLSFTRGVAQNLLKALKSLKSIGVAHCDIKLDNIMLTDSASLDAKLIDFGLAKETKKLSTGAKVQVTPFRAPEVILGLPFDESVDMWALGMVLTSIYFGGYPFPPNTEYETIQALVQIFGVPEAEVLNKAMYKSAFFTQENGCWRLYTAEEYTQLTGIQVENNSHEINLYEMMEIHQEMDETNEGDHKVFIDLLKRMLEVNPQKRITPSQALEHDFITMRHFLGARKNLYAPRSEVSMRKIPLSVCFSSSTSGSSNQSLKPSMSDGEIVVNKDMKEVPEDLQNDKDKAKMSSGLKSENTSFDVKKEELLEGNLGTYRVEEFLGEGSFGKVAKCSKLGSQECFAIKFINCSSAGQSEFKAMKLIKDLDPDESHLIKMYECFTFQNMTCIVYELLQTSLFDMWKNTFLVPLCFTRGVAQNLLKALESLKSIGVAHCDIKLDNIMLADSASINAKLIDFGLAIETKKLSKGDKIQPTRFRAPEVILGLPLDESVDMWALGMVLACIYFGGYPYPTNTEYETLRALVQIFGVPEAEVLNKAMYKSAFFTQENGSWRLYTAEEYTQSTGIQVENKSHEINLYEMIEIYREMDENYDDDDHRAFIDLLKRMLEVNPQKRITPSQALEHDFITMRHLSGARKNLYAPRSEVSTRNIPLSVCFSSSMSGSSNQSLKPLMSDGEIVDMKKVPSAGSEDERSSHSSSIRSCWETFSDSQEPLVSDGEIVDNKGIKKFLKICRTTRTRQTCQVD